MKEILNLMMVHRKLKSSPVCVTALTLVAAFLASQSAYANPVDCSKVAEAETLNWAITTEHTAPSTTIGFSELITTESTFDFQVYEVAVKNIVADPEQWIDAEAPVRVLNGRCVAVPKGVRRRPQNF